MTYARYPETVVNGVPVVATPAEIDIATADQLRADLLHATRNGHPVVVVDMTSTGFCDVAGTRALKAAYKRAYAEGSELRLVIPAGGAVPRIVTLTGTDRIVPCFTHLEEAVAKPPTLSPRRVPDPPQADPGCWRRQGIRLGRNGA